MKIPDTVVSSQVEQAEWNGFVDRHPDATGYHRWEWRQVFERAFGHRTEYVAARRDGDIVGVLPLVLFESWLFGTFMVSLPFVNYGGVLARDASSARALLDYATGLGHARRISHIELRHRGRVFDDLPLKRHKVGMMLRLARDPGSMWAAFDRKVRNQIRKAEKSGLTAEVRGGDALADFYPIFAENMRDLGTPVYSSRFFAEVLARFPANTRVFVVRSGSTPVAAAVSCVYRDTIEVPWAASLKAHRGSCPNHLLYWTAIQRAITQGCAVFDFGRSTPDEGTFHFKRQWGAEPEPLSWEYRLLSRSSMPDQSPKNPKFQTAIALWKRLPLCVATLVGPPIVRCIP